MEKYLEVERSLITKYRKKIWNRYTAGLKEYDLIEAGDKIAVCISGGKDSFMLAVCLRKLQQFSEIPFTLEFIMMDPGYNKENREMIEKNAEILKIDLKIFENNIFDIVSKKEKNACYLCAKMRRGHLYEYAESLGCNKIALGHHFNDVIETILLSIIYGSEYRTMMPKLHSTGHKGMQLIRPLYLVREADIIAWGVYNDLKFINCACRFTERSAKDEESSKRLEIKGIIAALKKKNPQVDINIFRSAENVRLATLISYIDKEDNISFLDKY